MEGKIILGNGDQRGRRRRKREGRGIETERTTRAARPGLLRSLSERNLLIVLSRALNRLPLAEGKKVGGIEKNKRAGRFGPVGRSLSSRYPRERARARARLGIRLRHSGREVRELRGIRRCTHTRAAIFLVPASFIPSSRQPPGSRDDKDLSTFGSRLRQLTPELKFRSKIPREIERAGFSSSK